MILIFHEEPSQNCEKRLLASSCLSVLLSAWNISAPTETILMKFNIEHFPKICRKKNLIFSKIGQALRVHMKNSMYEGHLESKERFAIKKYLLIIGKKKNMQVLSHTFTSPHSHLGHWGTCTVTPV